MAELAKNNFIKRAQLIHNNFPYDYSNINFVDIHTKVQIVCKSHGSFFVTPRTHLKGRGCPKCQFTKFDLFYSKAIKRFGNKYSYYMFSDYEFNPNNKIEIKCEKHGSFYQTTYNHIRGNGCPKCSYEIESQNICMGKYEFSKRANKIHKEKYNYDKVEYVNNHTKIIITCNIHGDFFQNPHDHLNGSGCPKCRNK